MEGKLAVIAERFNEIEKDNRILLQKMTDIMEDPKQNYAPFEKRSLNKGQ